MVTPAATYATRAAKAFSETLRRALADEPEGLGSAEELGRRAALAAVADQAWRHRLGALYATRQVQSLLGVGTRQAVTDRAKRHKLLALPTKSGRRLYPAFQFGASGEPHAELAEILALFAEAEVDPWTVAAWFQTPQALLGDETPARWLETGGEPETAVEAARRSAARLTA